jgi:hypothetical protein
VSHLPHLLSFALVSEIARAPIGRALQLRGRGLSRFHPHRASSPEMWRDIALQNRAALLAELDRYGARLAVFRELVDKGDGPGLQRLMAEARASRQALGPGRGAARPASEHGIPLPAPGHARARSHRSSRLEEHLQPRAAPGGARGGHDAAHGVLESDDTTVMRDALGALGVGVEPSSAGRLRVTGVGASGGFPVKAAELFMGNSGTAARSLAGVLALADGTYVLQGVPRMHERPIGDLVDALKPLARRSNTWATRLPAAVDRPAGAFGQADGAHPRRSLEPFVSAVLMALAWTGKGARVEIEGELTSAPYVELTLGLMERFGVKVAREDWKAFEIPAGAGYVSPGSYQVEGDASSASYFLAAGALGGGAIRVEGVGSDSLQGDVQFARVLEQLGAKIEMGADWIECSGRPPWPLSTSDMSAIPMPP